MTTIATFIRRAGLWVLLLTVGLSLPLWAQNNPNANPYSASITPATSVIQVGQTTTITAIIGNSGTDPLPVNAVTWSLQFPPGIITVNYGSLSLGGLPATPVDFVDGSGSYLFLTNDLGVIPPQTQYTVTLTVTGAQVGGPLQNTINNVHDPQLAQNTNAQDDNRNNPIEVIAPLPVVLAEWGVSGLTAKARC